MSKSTELYLKAKNLIPGGTQLLSKRPEMFLPGLWPAYYKKALGCEVWDLDDQKYIDMSYMGIGSCILGYAYPEINKIVKEAIDAGNLTTLNAPEEVELAELLCELHPWAQMVRYTRTGGEAMALALRIARAYSKKDMVLFCGYHGWHDWYLSSNLADDQALDGHLLPGLSPLGVPRKLKGDTIPFRYNNTVEFLELIKKYSGRIGAVVMESVRSKLPDPEFITTIREITKQEKIPLVVDEITAGWRLNIGGAHLLLGLEPDIAVFAKGISNGHPMAAIIGKGTIMQAAQDSFISSTYWTDKVGPASAIATIRTMQEKNIPAYLEQAGRSIQKGWEEKATKHSLKIHVDGLFPLSHFGFDYPEPLLYKTLFTQLMLEKGFLASTAFYASYAHKQEHIDSYLEAVDSVFQVIADGISKGQLRQLLKGEICHSGFARLT